MDKARLFRVDASYTAAIGEFETAESILEKALSLYLGANEGHLQGRTLIEMGEIAGYLNPDKGIAHIEHGMQLLNAVREPRMELRAEHHLAEFLCLAGRAGEALAIMDRARPLYRQFEEERVQLRLDLAEVHLQRGEKATALRLLEETTPTLASFPLHQNGLAAWLLFHKALAERRDRGPASPLFERLRLYYRRFWLMPGVEFKVR